MSNNKAKHVGSNSSFRDGFIEGAARAFFVMAYAEYADESNDDDLPKATNGEDWYDVAPSNPPCAYALAGELWASLEAMNHISMYQLLARAALADAKAIDAIEFGGDIAMQAMGTGVSWFDDHAKFEISIPRMEVSMYTFDSSAYSA
jgi:hypothetical protein